MAYLKCTALYSAYFGKNRKPTDSILKKGKINIYTAFFTVSIFERNRQKYVTHINIVSLHKFCYKWIKRRFLIKF